LQISILVLGSFQVSNSWSQNENQPTQFTIQINRANHLIEVDPDSAAIFIETIEKNTSFQREENFTLHIDLMKMKLLYMQGDLTTSISLGEALLVESENIHDFRLKADIMVNLSRSYQFFGYRPKQLELSAQTLQLLHHLRDTSLIITAFNSIGNVLKKTEDLDRSFKFYQSAYEIAKYSNDSIGMAQSLTNIGTFYLLSKNYDSTKVNLFKALKLYETTNQQSQKCLVLIRIGRQYLYNDQIDSAEYFFHQSLDLSSRMNIEPWIGRGYHYLGNVHQHRKDYELANTYYDSALVKLLKVQDVFLLRGTYNKMAHTYEALGMPDSALQMQKHFMDMKDIIEERRNIGLIESLEWNYRVQKKEKKITFLKEKSIILSEKNRAERSARIWLFVALAITLFLAFLLYLLFKQRNKSLSQEKQLRLLDKAQSDLKIEHEKKIQKISEEKHSLEMEIKNKELTTLTMEISQKSQDVVEIHDKIKTLEDTIKPDSKLEFGVLKELRTISKQLKIDAGKEKEWQQFKLHFEQVHADFFKNLKAKHPPLTDYDMKLCAYFHMNLGVKQVANIMNVSYAAIKKQRTRMRKKMKIEADTSLLHYLNTISTND